ncbi:BON domain-containing protein [Mesorhizobium sp. M0152]|uniref:BON domain-containing protein n=1 Tax=Mesorhizobium sp. M0152 TaxID=2956898 RepID=UPI00333A3BB0
MARAQPPMTMCALEWTDHPSGDDHTRHLGASCRPDDATSHNNVPIVDRERVVGIITRTDLLLVLIRAMSKQGTTPPDDELIRKAILAELQPQTWSGGDVIDVRVSDGLVELKGAIVDERQRKAAIVAAEKVAGVGQVKDRLLLSTDPFSVMVS